MASPYLFTESWVRAPGVSGTPRVWAEVWGHTHFLGRLVGGNALLTRSIRGSNQFAVIIEDNGAESCAQDLEQAQIHCRLQVSPIGVPKLRPGRNLLPLLFASGTPHLSVWYMENAADLEITRFKTSPKHPRPGQPVKLVFTVTNRGSGRSTPTDLTVNNNTTMLMSETFRRVGVATIPSLKPGRRTEIKIPWLAATEMTWYGQNPSLQLMDAWIDMEKRTADANRDNNRLQQYIVLRLPNGRLPQIPGYSELP